MHNQVRPRDDGSYVVVNDDVIEIAMQGSTHRDALAHWGAIEPDVPGVYFGGAGLNETFPEFGAETLGIDQLAAGVVTRGVLLDFVREIDGSHALFLGMDTTLDWRRWSRVCGARTWSLLQVTPFYVHGFNSDEAARVRTRGRR